jgi:hypothetical protein
MPKMLILIEVVPILPRDRIKKTEKEGKVSLGSREEKTMKLNLLFIVMDLLIVLAYPIVFVHGKLRQFLRPKESIRPANLLVIVPVAPDR